MPALVNSRLGELGSRLAEGTIVCRFSRKKSKKDCLISEAFMMQWSKAEPRRCAKNRRSSSRSSQNEESDWMLPCPKVNGESRMDFLRKDCAPGIQKTRHHTRESAV